MNRTDYDNKVRALLNNRNHYALTNSNPLPKLLDEIVTYTTHLFLSGRIDSDTFKVCLLIQAAVSLISIFCPKSTSCKYPTSQISAFVDHFLQQTVVHILSYLKDSTHFLSEVLNFEKCLINTFL